MEVNFNNLRRSIIANYNNLAEKVLNVDRFPEEEYDKIRPELRALRDDICTLACIYDDERGIITLADEKIIVVP